MRKRSDPRAPHFSRDSRGLLWDPRPSASAAGSRPVRHRVYDKLKKKRVPAGPRVNLLSVSPNEGLASLPTKADFCRPTLEPQRRVRGFVTSVLISELTLRVKQALYLCSRGVHAALFELSFSSLSRTRLSAVATIASSFGRGAQPSRRLAFSLVAFFTLPSSGRI